MEPTLESMIPRAQDPTTIEDHLLIETTTIEDPLLLYLDLLILDLISIVSIPLWEQLKALETTMEQ